MPTRRFPKAIDQRGRKLRRQFEHAALERMIEQMEAADLTPETIARLVHSYCELKRHDVAAIKHDVTLELAGIEDQFTRQDMANREPNGGIRGTVQALYGITAPA